MMAMQLRTFDIPQEAADALALAVAADLQAALANSLEPIAARALLLVSGGRSPLPFFAALARQPLPWEQIDVSLVDERSVPAEHADANAALVRRHLLQGAAAAARFLPLMADPPEPEDPLHWAQRSAFAACGRLELKCPAAVVLGLGADGHTASLFRDSPDWPEASTTDRRYVPLVPAAAAHPRVGLSLSALIAQGECYVWSNGPEKLKVIKEAQALAAGVAEGLVDGIAMHGAGAFALLVAQPQVNLRVFHSLV
jgi:6-phosphogluconolactonase